MTCQPSIEHTVEESKKHMCLWDYVVWNMFLNRACMLFFPVICKLSKSTGHMFSFFEFSMAQWIETLCSCTTEVRSRCWKNVEWPKCLHQIQQQLSVFQAVTTCCSTLYIFSYNDSFKNSFWKSRQLKWTTNCLWDYVSGCFNLQSPKFIFL